MKLKWYQHRKLISLIVTKIYKLELRVGGFSFHFLSPTASSAGFSSEEPFPTTEIPDIGLVYISIWLKHTDILS